MAGTLALLAMQRSIVRPLDLGSFACRLQQALLGGAPGETDQNNKKIPEREINR